MRIFFLLFLLSFAFLSCKKSQDCFNEPARLTFEFVNEEGENMITNRQLLEHMFEFKKELGGNQNKTVAYEIDENDRIVLFSLDLTDGRHQYKFLSIIHSFVFVIDGKNYENCGGAYIDQVLFRDVESEQKDGFIQIKLIRR